MISSDAFLKINKPLCWIMTHLNRRPVCQCSWQAPGGHWREHHDLEGRLLCSATTESKRLVLIALSSSLQPSVFDIQVQMLNERSTIFSWLSYHIFQLIWLCVTYSTRPDKKFKVYHRTLVTGLHNGPKTCQLRKEGTSLRTRRQVKVVGSSFTSLLFSNSQQS